MTRRLIPLISLISILIVVVSCATPIRNVIDKPQDFSDKTITVQGVVTDTISLPLRDEGIYRIRQAKFSLWIFSKKIPEREEFVTVTGKVKTGFKISGKTFGIILIESSY